MKKHTEPSKLAGKTVKIKTDVFKYGGREFEVRDWWDRCSGFPWSFSIVNPVCTHYMMRASFTGNPDMFNNEVLYGRIGNFMYLIHESEIEK